jgi:hypothetical protein
MRFVEFYLSSILSGLYAFDRKEFTSNLQPPKKATDGIVLFRHSAGTVQTLTERTVNWGVFVWEPRGGAAIKIPERRAKHLNR